MDTKRASITVLVLTSIVGVGVATTADRTAAADSSQSQTAVDSGPKAKQPQDYVSTFYERENDPRTDLLGWYKAKNSHSSKRIFTVIEVTEWPSGKKWGKKELTIEPGDDEIITDRWLGFPQYNCVVKSARYID